MIKKLKAWLKRPGNSTAKMASILGYKSSSTIANWITRKSIPSHKKNEVDKILKGKK